MSDVNPRVGRLRWRSRRGLKELDGFLEPFFNGDLACCDDAALHAVEQLLEAQDLQLLDWLLGRSVPRDQQLVLAIELIRNSHSQTGTPD